MRNFATTLFAAFASIAITATTLNAIIV